MVSREPSDRGSALPSYLLNSLSRGFELQSFHQQPDFLALSPHLRGMTQFHSYTLLYTLLIHSYTLLIILIHYYHSYTLLITRLQVTLALYNWICSLVAFRFLVVF